MLSRPQRTVASLSQRLALAVTALFALLATTAHADIDLEITGVRQEIADNVRAFLSLSRYAKRKDVTEDAILRLGQRIPLEAQQALQPFGYYEPKITHAVARNGENWKVSINIDPGRAVRLSDVDIQVAGPGAQHPAIRTVLRQRALRASLRLDHGIYDQVKTTLLRTAINNGYLDAYYERSELLVDVKQRRATATLHLQTGEQYRFGKIEIHQSVLRDDIARRLLRMHEGDAYTNENLLQTQYAFDDSQYYSTVNIDSGDRDRENHLVPVQVETQTNRKHRYSAAVGYATDTGARGKLNWDDRFVNQLGHRAGVELIESQPLQSLVGRYTIPVMDIAQEKLEFTLSGKKEELGNDVLSTRYEFATGLTQAMGRWQRVLFVRLSNETTEITSPGGTTMTQLLLIPGISYATAPNQLFRQQPLRYSLYGELSGSPQTLGSDASYLRLLLQGERMFDLSRRWHLRLKGQAGAIWTSNFDGVPASQRFFAGGDNSVRGFALNDLSPVDPPGSGSKVGGHNLLVATVELERTLKWPNFRAAVFTDAGNAFDSFSDGFAYSAGVGIRYNVAVASLGIDIAQPLYAPPEEIKVSGRGPRLHLHISTVF